MKTLILQFKIKGNHEDPFGNALPKLKMTGKQSWTPKAQRYVQWKAWVVRQLLDAIEHTDMCPTATRQLGLTGKPLTTSADTRAEMDIVILWKDNTHGDAENIFGSIADSLFKQDKWLDGSFKSRMSPDKQGSVEITIKFYQS